MSGRTRRLAQGSIWRLVGTIPEGSVYQPVGTILTAQAMNIHEAYIVVADGRWVGFWLVAENAYASVAAPVAIELSPEK